MEDAAGVHHTKPACVALERDEHVPRLKRRLAGRLYGVPQRASRHAVQERHGQESLLARPYVHQEEVDELHERRVAQLLHYLRLAVEALRVVRLQEVLYRDKLPGLANARLEDLAEPALADELKHLVGCRAVSQIAEPYRLEPLPERLETRVAVLPPRRKRLGEHIFRVRKEPIYAGTYVYRAGTVLQHMRPARKEGEVCLFVVALETLVRRLAGQQFVQHHAHGEDVALHVTVEIRVGEVRGHVVERPSDVAGGRRGRAPGLLRDLKVDQLYVAVVAEEYVTRLDVAMHYPAPGSVDQRGKGRVGDAQRLVDVKSGRIARQFRLQRVALQELLHHNVDVVEQPRLGETPVVSDDVWMLQFRQLPRPLLKFPPLGLVLVLHRHHLQGDDRSLCRYAFRFVLADGLVDCSLGAGTGLDLLKDPKASYDLFARFSHSGQPCKEQVRTTSAPSRSSARTSSALPDLPRCRL